MILSKTNHHGGVATSPAANTRRRHFTPEWFSSRVWGLGVGSRWLVFVITIGVFRVIVQQRGTGDKKHFLTTEGATCDMEPIISWPGGRQRVARVVTDLFPGDFEVFVEPFCGALSITFEVFKRFGTDIKYRLSDANEHLIEAHQTLIENTNAVLSEIRAMVLEWSYYDTKEKQKFYFTRRAEYNQEWSGPIRKAALFFFLSRTCFNGIWRVNLSNEMNTPCGDIDRIPGQVLSYDNAEDVARVLGGPEFKLSLSDFRKPLLRVIENAEHEEQFVFLDPPRYKLGSQSFPWGDRMELAEILDALTAARVRWMLLDRDDDLTKNLYAQWEIHFLDRATTVSGRKNGRGRTSDLLVTNYEVNLE